MRSTLSLAALIAALVLSGVAPAGDDGPGRETRETAATDGPMSMRPAAADDYMAEPCWGDRYEKDEDLNEGARISTEEILRVINPLQS